MSWLTTQLEKRAITWKGGDFQELCAHTLALTQILVNHCTDYLHFGLNILLVKFSFNLRTCLILRPKYFDTCISSPMRNNATFSDIKM